MQPVEGEEGPKAERGGLDKVILEADKPHVPVSKILNFCQAF